MVIIAVSIIPASKTKMTDYNIDSLELTDIWLRSLAYPIQARLKMLRKHYLTEVNGLIAQQKRFKPSDFGVVVGDDRGRYKLQITYLYDPNYQFTALIKLAADGVQGNADVEIVASPGNIFNKERFETTVRSLSDQIQNWLSRLASELSSVPVQRQVEEQRQQIQDILNELADFPKEYFSQEEAEAVGSKLDDLEARLIKNLEENETNRQLLESKIKTIEADMAMLKDNIQVLNKAGWAKSLVIRAYEWSKDPLNRKLLKSGAAVAAEFLLPGN